MTLVELMTRESFKRKIHKLINHRRKFKTDKKRRKGNKKYTKEEKKWEPRSWHHQSQISQTYKTWKTWKVLRKHTKNSSNRYCAPLQLGGELWRPTAETTELLKVEIKCNKINRLRMITLWELKQVHSCHWIIQFKLAEVRQDCSQIQDLMLCWNANPNEQLHKSSY